MNFLLSCISTRHSMLKKHWVQTKDETQCPVTVLGNLRPSQSTKEVAVRGSLEKPKEDQGGLLCLLNENGEALEQIELPMPAGMTFSDQGVLVASIEEVNEVAPDLSTIQRNVVSLPPFNMLHSLSRSSRGYLVASTGVDAILEFTRSGELLWSWWATEHGFEYTPKGERRVLDMNGDYRGTKFGTLAQTTHVNSVAELPDGTVLATLFHQGMVIRIEREDGSWQPVLEGLDHPHSVRILADNYFTVADTGRGRGLMVNIKDGKGRIEAEVDAQTNWLQDCAYDQHHDNWILVDGKNSHVTLRAGITGERAIRRFDLDPEWRLYEILPLDRLAS
jgi:hypothetical protein